MPTAWRYRHSTGANDGIIIATIITIHMPRNDVAAPSHVCSGIRIQAIDIVQPPGIVISPIADIGAHQTTVTAAQTAKSRAETQKKACSERAQHEPSRPRVLTATTGSLIACCTRRGG